MALRVTSTASNFGSTTVCEADDNLFTTGAAHGLVAGDRIRFSALTGGTGLAINTNYFVIASGLTATTFRVSATAGGSEVDVTVDLTAATWSKFANLITAAKNHGLRVGQKVAFRRLTGGAGITAQALRNLSPATVYHVISSGLTARAFKVSATAGGAEVAPTSHMTAGEVRRVNGMGR